MIKRDMVSLEDYIMNHLMILSATRDEKEAQIVAGILMEIGYYYTTLDWDDLEGAFDGRFTDDSDKRA